MVTQTSGSPQFNISNLLRNHPKDELHAMVFNGSEPEMVNGDNIIGFAAARGGLEQGTALGHPGNASSEGAFNDALFNHPVFQGRGSEGLNNPDDGLFADRNSTGALPVSTNNASSQGGGGFVGGNGLASGQPVTGGDAGGNNAGVSSANASNGAFGNGAANALSSATASNGTNGTNGVNGTGAASAASQNTNTASTHTSSTTTDSNGNTTYYTTNDTTTNNYYETTNNNTNSASDHGGGGQSGGNTLIETITSFTQNITENVTSTVNNTTNDIIDNSNNSIVNTALNDLTNITNNTTNDLTNVNSHNSIVNTALNDLTNIANNTTNDLTNVNSHNSIVNTALNDLTNITNNTTNDLTYSNSSNNFINTALNDVTGVTDNTLNDLTGINGHNTLTEDVTQLVSNLNLPGGGPSSGHDHPPATLLAVDVLPDSGHLANIAILEPINGTPALDIALSAAPLTGLPGVGTIMAGTLETVNTDNGGHPLASIDVLPAPGGLLQASILPDTANALHGVEPMPGTPAGGNGETLLAADALPDSGHLANIAVLEPVTGNPALDISVPASVLTSLPGGSDLASTLTTLSNDNSGHPLASVDVLPTAGGVVDASVLAGIIPAAGGDIAGPAHDVTGALGELPDDMQAAAGNTVNMLGNVANETHAIASNLPTGEVQAITGTIGNGISSVPADAQTVAGNIADTLGNTANEAHAVAGSIGDVASSIPTGVQAVADTLHGSVGSLPADVQTVASNTADALGGAVSQAHAVTGTVGDVVSSVPAGDVQTLASNITDTLGNTANDAHAVASSIPTGVQAVADTLHGGASGLPADVQTVASNTADALGGAVSQAHAVAGTVGDVVGNAGSAAGNLPADAQTIAANTNDALGNAVSGAHAAAMAGDSVISAVASLPVNSLTASVGATVDHTASSLDSGLSAAAGIATPSASALATLTGSTSLSIGAGDPLSSLLSSHLLTPTSDGLMSTASNAGVSSSGWLGNVTANPPSITDTSASAVHSASTSAHDAGGTLSGLNTLVGSGHDVHAASIVASVHHLI